MGRFDRYLLSQLMGIFGFSAVVLVLIYWINRAVRLFDWLIASGQSATVFLEFTALTLPNVIRIVLPVAAFVATLYTANRMSSESELVIVQANGFSPFRLARPVLVFGLIVAAFMSVLVHIVVPMSWERLNEREGEVAENVTARLLVEGRFVHPAEGMTLYIRSIAGSGELQDVYLHDNREPARQITYTATRARLVRTESGPRLIMFDGMAQALSASNRSLSVTRFEDFAIDVTSLIDGSSDTPSVRNMREATTAQLLSGDPEIAAAFSTRPRQMIREGHSRIVQPLLAITAPLIGLATVLLGGFSRFGVWQQIFGAVVIVVGIYMLQNAAEDMSLGLGRLGWAILYLPQGLAALTALLILWLAANTQVLRRRSAAAP